MGILLCEQNFRDVWIRNKSVRAEIGQILHTDTLTHIHTTAAKLVVRVPGEKFCSEELITTLSCLHNKMLNKVYGIMLTCILNSVIAVKM